MNTVLKNYLAQPLQVLLVEDDEDDYLIAQGLFEDLSERHYDLTWVDNYDDSVPAIEAQSHDVYLIDYRLGAHTGTELLVLEPFVSRRAPAIIMTGFSDPLADVKALRAGAVDYLEKADLTPRMLDRSIRYAIERIRAERTLREREWELKTITEALIDGVMVIDEAERIRFCNPAAQWMLGVVEFQIWRNEQSGLLTENGTVDFAVMNHDGEQRWLESRCTRVFWRGEPCRLVSLRDITERVIAREAQRHSEERYMLAAQGANDGLWDWDLANNTVYFSSRWLDMLGYKDDPYEGNADKWFQAVHPDDLPALKSAIEKHLSHRTAHLKCCYRIRHQDGRYLWMLCRGKAVKGGDGKATRMAGSQTDVTEQKQHEAELARDAIHDALTGLPNKQLLHNRLEYALIRTRRSPSARCAVIFLDIDDFKTVNDSYGHEMGDRLLVKLAHRLKSHVRDCDTIARFGGDEFVILLEDFENDSEVVEIAERLRCSLEKAFILDEIKLFVTTSIGIVFSTEGCRHPDDLLRDADTALYRAKGDGKNRISTFDLRMREAALKRMQMRGELQQALEEQQFVLYYQPILSLVTGMITGFEALIRWQHPIQGLVSPAEFIPLAEETGLIVAIGRWALIEARRQLSEWETQHPGIDPVYVSVNLSARQLSQEGLLQTLEQIRYPDEGDVQRIRLEITETSIMENQAAASDLLAQARAMGFKICMDDFGTGYSSLTMLHEFPIDVLKIDRAFVNRLNPAYSQGRQVLSAVMILANALELDVVAEGVETEYHAMELKALNCPHVQGYFFSKPLRQESAVQLLIATFD